jgi:hypothetical protein
LAKEGLELNERLNEKDGGGGKGGVKPGSGVGDAGVNDGARLEAEARELGESTGHAGARRRGGMEAADVEAEGVEEADGQMLDAKRDRQRRSPCD